MLFALQVSIHGTGMEMLVDYLQRKTETTPEITSVSSGCTCSSTTVRTGRNKYSSYPCEPYFRHNNEIDFKNMDLFPM